MQLSTVLMRCVSGGRGVNTLTEKLSKTSNMQSWLSRFSRGKIKNPGIETLQSVIDALNEIESAQMDTLPESSSSFSGKPDLAGESVPLS